jgi:hypothetical protein
MLTAEQRRDLRDAMLAAFDEKGLASLALLRLDENVEAIAGNGPLPDRVLQMIRWAERQGRLADLLNGCLLEVPRNADLAAVIGRLRAASPSTTPAAALPASPSGPDSHLDPTADLLSGRSRLTWVHHLGHRHAVSPATIAGLMALMFAIGMYVGHLWGSGSVLPAFSTNRIQGKWQVTPFGIALRVTGVRRVTPQRVRLSLEYRNDDTASLGMYVRRSSLGTGGQYLLGAAVNNLPLAEPGMTVPFDIEFSGPPPPSGTCTLYLELGPDPLRVTNVSFSIFVE